MDWTSEDIVKSGNHTYPLSMVNITDVSPPSFQLINSNLEANNTEIDVVFVAGNSGTRLREVEVSLLYLIEDSEIGLLRCRNGDFNIRIANTEIGTLETMMITEFNLKMEGSDLGLLNLMYAHPEAPNNVELKDTSIGTLYLTPSSPPVYRFDNVLIESSVTLEAGEASSPPIITGSLRFGPNCTIHQDEKEGESVLSRVYRIELLDEGSPVSGEHYTITEGNRTIHKGVTSANGTMVFPLRFVKSYGIIENPSQGGPTCTTSTTSRHQSH